MMNSKITFSVAILALFLNIACSSQKQRDEEKKSIRDLVLIYNGGKFRTVTWDKEHFSAYVATDATAEKPAEWLFDGFLFLEISYDSQRGFAKNYRANGCRKVEWIDLIDQWLTPGLNIMALDDAISDARENIGGEYNPRKLVISLPEPLFAQTDWGEVDGKALDFYYDKDRVAASKWYVDYIIKRIEEAKLKNLELDGFYWLAEHVIDTHSIVNEVADYVHSKGMDFYWIPYNRGVGRERWAQWGFDHAYLQPNHFFHLDVPDSRIQDTYDFAAAANMSVEMEFDDRVLESKGDRRDRLTAYIDIYEKNGVFNNLDVAYYQEVDTFYKLKHGTENERALYDRLVKLITARQKEHYAPTIE